MPYPQVQLQCHAYQLCFAGLQNICTFTTCCRQQLELVCTPLTLLSVCKRVCNLHTHCAAVSAAMYRAHCTQKEEMNCSGKASSLLWTARADPALCSPAWHVKDTWFALIAHRSHYLLRSNRVLADCHWPLTPVNFLFFHQTNALYCCMPL